MDDARIQALIDRNEIIDVFSRYGAAVDQRDAAAYRSCFADEVTVDMAGTKNGGGPADEWVELAMRAVGVFEVTQHVITNHLVEIEGDSARCDTCLRAQHWNPNGSMMVGGNYSARLVRSPLGWRISNLTMTVSWTQQG